MLGGGSQSQVADEPNADDDQEFERKQDVRLFLNLLYFQILKLMFQVCSVHTVFHLFKKAIYFWGTLHV